VIALIAALAASCTAKPDIENMSARPSDGGDAMVDAVRDTVSDWRPPNLRPRPTDAAWPPDTAGDARLVTRDIGPPLSADGGCDRDPYIPTHYAPPCEQPRPSQTCAQRWCAVTPGCYIMGSPWCEPRRAKTMHNPVQVTLTHAFRIGQFELTQREWTSLGLPNRSGLIADGTGDCIGDDCPASNMTWFEALAFTNRLSARDGLPACYELSECAGEMGQGMLCNAVRFTNASVYECRGYRLPTGAEWEYAARAGTKTPFYTGDIAADSLDSCDGHPELLPIAWYCANAGPYTHPVGEKVPNDWGIYDMIGNAAEWVGSIGPAGEGYGDGPFVDHGSSLQMSGFLDADVPFAHFVQYRGGFWNSWPAILLVGKAATAPPKTKSSGIGLRLAQTVSLANGDR
jgi:formylglycine-generating enzyme